MSWFANWVVLNITFRVSFLMVWATSINPNCSGGSRRIWRHRFPNLLSIFVTLDGARPSPRVSNLFDFLHVLGSIKLGPKPCHNVWSLRIWNKSLIVYVFFWCAEAPTFPLLHTISAFRKWVKSQTYTVYMNIHIYIYIGCGPLPVTVTTRIITFSVGNPYKPSFTTVNRWS